MKFLLTLLLPFIMEVKALSVSVSSYFSQKSYYVGEEVTLNVNYNIGEDGLVEFNVTPSNFEIYQTIKATSNWSKSGTLTFKGKATKLGPISAKITLVEAVDKKDEVVNNIHSYANAKVIEKEEKKPSLIVREKPKLTVGENVSVAPPNQVTKKITPPTLLKDDISLKIITNQKVENNENTYTIIFDTFNPIEIQLQKALSEKTENLTLKLGDKKEVKVKAENGNEKNYIINTKFKDKDFVIKDNELIFAKTDLKHFEYGYFDKLKTLKYKNFLIIDKVENNQLKTYFYNKGYIPFIQTTISNQKYIYLPFEDYELKENYSWDKITLENQEIRVQKNKDTLVKFLNENGKEVLFSFQDGNFQPYQLIKEENSTFFDNYSGMIYGFLGGMATVTLGQFSIKLFKRKRGC